MEEEKLKPKHRPIVRLGLFLISHSFLVSVGCCSAGLIALLLLPVLAKNTYISENALMPGSAHSMLDTHDMTEAKRLAKELSAYDLSKRRDVSIAKRSVIAKFMSDLGAEVNFHKFHSPTHQFSPMRFFSGPDAESVQEKANHSICGVSTIGIIRAPRGDGKEAIVLVTPYNIESTASGEVLSLSVGYAVFSMLSRVTWLAKDIIWVISDSRVGDYAPVNAWLREYHTPSFSTSTELNYGPCAMENTSFVSETRNFNHKRISDDFRRAGTMTAALVLKVVDTDEKLEDSLNIYVEASNGQMPNLDLINVVSYLAVHRRGLRVKIEKCLVLLNAKWLNALGRSIELVGMVLRSLNPHWSFGISASDYVEGTATLASSIYRQALGIPTGPHGAFRDFQVDAVTLVFAPRKINFSEERQYELIVRFSRLIEGVVRSINNLLEKFHQSFFLYLLTSPSKFVSVGVYMIAFAFMVVPLPIVAASLYCKANELAAISKSEHSLTIGDSTFSQASWHWPNAAKEVLLVHTWGLLTLLLPSFVSKLPNQSSATSFSIWAGLSLIIIVLLYIFQGHYISSSQASDSVKVKWLFLKSVTISAAFIELLLMSVVNYATAQIGALLIVPLCLAVCPLKDGLQKASSRGLILLRMLLTFLFGIAACPPVAFFLLKGALEEFSNLSFGDFWNWMESMWIWNSATYLYLGMVHLPCWALCMRIFFH